MSSRAMPVGCAVFQRRKLLRRLQEVDLSPDEAWALLDRVQTHTSSAADRERLAHRIRVTTAVTEQLRAEPAEPEPPAPGERRIIGWLGLRVGRGSIPRLLRTRKRRASGACAPGRCCSTGQLLEVLAATRSRVASHAPQRPAGLCLRPDHGGMSCRRVLASVQLRAPTRADLSWRGRDTAIPPRGQGHPSGRPIRGQPLRIAERLPEGPLARRREHQERRHCRGLLTGDAGPHVRHRDPSGIYVRAGRAT
jgi:hypothetical protein